MATHNSRTYEYEGSQYILPAHNMASLKDSEQEKLIQMTLIEGRPLTRDEVFLATGTAYGYGDKAVNDKYLWYQKLLNDNSNTFGFDSSGKSTGTSTGDAQQAAFDSYYKDLFSTEAGTTGGNLYNAYIQQEQNAGRNAMLNANAIGSQLAVQQAATVKSIADQVRAERMAKLRAGMSESQIANQDMIQLMSNINALNDQAVAANQAYLQGQQQYNDAQATAYTNWANTLGQLGTAGSAYAAADAGDAYLQTLKRMQATGENYKTANKYVTGQVNTGGNK